MKKIMILLVLSIVGIASNAQSTKKVPPPPPPQPKNEIVKSEPPKIKVSDPLVMTFTKETSLFPMFQDMGTLLILKRKTVQPKNMI